MLSHLGINGPVLADFLSTSDSYIVEKKLHAFLVLPQARATPRNVGH